MAKKILTPFYVILLTSIQQQSEDNPDCKKMVPILEKIQDKQYANAADVTKAAGLVQ
jgi:hypothetical protein